MQYLLENQEKAEKFSFEKTRIIKRLSCILYNAIRSKLEDVKRLNSNVI